MKPSTRTGSVEERCFVPKKVKEPTNAIPGSEEKILILQARVAQGFECHHPEDRVLESAPFIGKYDYARVGVAQNSTSVTRYSMRYDGDSLDRFG